MTKGIEEIDARFFVARLALRAIVDVLADKKIVMRSDITSRLRDQEEHMHESSASADLIDQLRDLRKFLE